MKRKGLYTITEVAYRAEIDVVPKTIVRWENAGKIQKAKRDYRGWRVYTEEDIAKIASYVKMTHERKE
jgi:DNA-binding transcriptional MerR regulator